jgi:hypothetical protein
MSLLGGLIGAVVLGGIAHGALGYRSCRCSTWQRLASRSASRSVAFSDLIIGSPMSW